MTVAATPDVSAQKLLLFSAIGYLHCLKSGACDPGEVHRTIGQPRILEALRLANASPAVIDVMNGLDEPGWGADSMGTIWRDEAIALLVSDCEALLKELGPPDPESFPPTLLLFPSKSD